ncbi:unnamed protein product, partial [Mesorhabditis spiculigera]
MKRSLLFFLGLLAVVVHVQAVGKICNQDADCQGPGPSGRRMYCDKWRAGSHCAEVHPGRCLAADDCKRYGTRCITYSEGKPGICVGLVAP